MSRKPPAASGETSGAQAAAVPHQLLSPAFIADPYPFCACQSRRSPVRRTGRRANAPVDLSGRRPPRGTTVAALDTDRPVWSPNSTIGSLRAPPVRFSRGDFVPPRLAPGAAMPVPRAAFMPHGRGSPEP